MIKNINNNLPKREKVLADGRKIVLVLDDGDLTVRFYLNDEEINYTNHFSFEEHEEKPDKYLITGMFSPISKAGLGRTALEFFIEEMCATLHVRSFNCPEMSDGSNILPEAVPFVQKMINEGLIEDNSEELDDDN